MMDCVGHVFGLLGLYCIVVVRCYYCIGCTDDARPSHSHGPPRGCASSPANPQAQSFQASIRSQWFMSESPLIRYVRYSQAIIAVPHRYRDSPPIDRSTTATVKHPDHDILCPLTFHHKTRDRKILGAFGHQNKWFVLDPWY